jgi:hypothetical protein
MLGRFKLWGRVGPVGFAMLVPGFAFAQATAVSGPNAGLAPLPPPYVGSAPAPSSGDGDGDAEAASSTPESDGPLPPVPSSAPMYYAPVPPPYRFRHRREWALQLRAEAVGMGRDAAPGSGMGGLGVSLRPRPTPHFAVDFGLDFLGGHDFYAERRSEVAFSVNPMFFLNPGHPVQVYLLGGINFSGAEVEHADQSKSRYRYIGLDAGIGLEFRLARHVALDADLVAFARRRTDRAAHDSPEFVDPVTGRTSNSSGGGLARVGLAYYW